MRLLLLSGLLLACLPAPAQSADTLAPRLPAVAQSAAPDTAAAIHRLFEHKRRVGSYVVGGTFLAVTTAAVVVALQPEPHDDGGFGVIEPVGSGFLAGLIIGAGLPVMISEAVSFGKYSSRNEARAQEMLRQHQLPRWLRHRLTPKYFEQPTR